MSFVILLSVLAVAFALLAAAEFTGSAMSVPFPPSSLSQILTIISQFFYRAQKGGGAVGIVTAMIAYYIGLSEMLEAEARPIGRLPRGVLYINEP